MVFIKQLKIGIKMDREDVYDLADKIYWEVIDILGVTSKCVIADQDNPDDTINTELGTELYYAIEDIIFKNT
jgi:hypothetical protein